jgi:Phage baseplate assembly protein W
MSWSGMNKSGGQAIYDIEHIRQSITDILTTPVGSRVMRREYGSDIFTLLDAPINGATKMRLMAATVMAILNWEPRVKVTNMSIDITMNGEMVLDVTFERQDGARTKDSVAINLGMAA